MSTSNQVINEECQCQCQCASHADAHLWPFRRTESMRFLGVSSTGMGSKQCGRREQYAVEKGESGRGELCALWSTSTYARAL